MIPYIIHSSILVAICYLIYQLFLKRITFFQANRWLLIFFLFISFTLPLLQVPQEWSLRTVDPSGENNSQSLADQAEFNAINKHYKAQKLSPPKDIQATNSEKAGRSFPISDLEAKVQIIKSSWYSNISMSTLLTYIYFIGLVFFIGRLLVHFLALNYKIISNPAIKDGKFKIIKIKQDIAPCSFWNCIFLNPEKYDPTTYAQIIQHEKIHISDRHSLDILLTEIVVAIQWFNPFAWLYHSLVANNLEYLTDQSMVTKGADKKAYQISLLKVSVPHYSPYLATNYNHSFLKKRIIMMNTKKSPVHNSWKYLLVLPILGLSIACLNAVKSVVDDDITQIIRDVDSPSSENREQTNDADITNALVVKTEFVYNKGIIENTSQDKMTDYAASNYYLETISFPLTGKWEGEIKGNKICLVYRSKSDQYNRTWDSDNCVDKSKFSSIPMNASGEFTLVRDAGTMTFNGKFENGKGAGDYSFSENNNFKESLSKDGIKNISEETMFYAFMNDVNKSYISDLKKMGFTISEEDFESVAHSGTPVQKIQNCSNDLKAIGYKDFTLRDIAQLDIHDVSTEYIREMHQLGFKDLTLEKMVKASIHDVTPSYFKELKSAGLEDIKYDELISFAIHDIEPNYIKELQNISSRKLSNGEIIKAGIHEVSADYFEELKAAGLNEMTMDELTKFAIHEISPEYVKELRNISGRDLSNDEIIKAGIHEVSVDYFEELKAAGLNEMTMDELTKFAIHEISPEYVKELRNISGRDLSNDEIIKAGIHEVSADYFEELKAAGLNEMTMDELTKFAIHEISPEYVKELRNISGRDLSNDEIIKAGIHEVSVDYFEELKAAGLNDMTMDELTKFAIHDVQPQFIVSVKKLGYTDLSNDDIIQLNIHDVTTEYISSLHELGFKKASIDEIVDAYIHDVTADFIRKVNASGKTGLTLEEYKAMRLKEWEERQ